MWVASSSNMRTRCTNAVSRSPDATSSALVIERGSRRPLWQGSEEGRVGEEPSSGARRGAAILPPHAIDLTRNGGTVGPPERRRCVDSRDVEPSEGIGGNVRGDLLEHAHAPHEGRVALTGRYELRTRHRARVTTAAVA